MKRDARTMFVSGGGEAGSLVRTTDWSRTPLGPAEAWPESLIHYVNMILEMPSPAIIFWGEQQTQIYNDGYSFIMGPRHPKYFGAPYKECWPDTYPFIIPMMKQVLERGEVVKVEKAFFAVTRHGFYEEAYFTFTFSAIRDDAGAIAGIIQPINEVTETVLGERRAETLRALAPRADSLDPTQDAIAALGTNPKDIPFALIYLWDASRKRLELSACTESLDDCEAVLPDFAEAASRAVDARAPLRIDDLDRVLAGKHLGPWEAPTRSAFALPMRRSASDPLRGIVVFGISPALHFDEKYRGFLEVAAGQVATAIDSTRALREAEERAEALAKLDREKTAFFSNVSHEFRTPLTLLIGPTEDALASQERALRGSALESVYRNELRLLRLVNALLDFSRIEAGRVQATFEPTDLAKATIELAGMFESAVERAGLTLTVRCEPLPQPVYVDREMWEKIVLNLLSNAFKFTFTGEIEVVLRATEGRVEFKVRDTGTGIAPEELPRLFERFHRIEGAKARTHEGSGIGLALVQELVRMHAGDIRAESELEKGTTFTISLSFGTTHLPQDRIGVARGRSSTATRASAYVEEASRWLPQASADPASEAVSASADLSRCVLVADDNADMRDYLMNHLSKRWNVQAVADGEAALAAAKSGGIDLILTDVMMPRLDGFGLLDALRKNPTTNAIPVIMLSARAGEEARVEGLQAGADDYLVKPFSARELVARVETQLRLAHARDEGARQWRRLLKLLDQIPTPISILRLPERRYEFSNRAHARLTGREVIGKTLDEAYPDMADKSGWDVFDRIAEAKEARINSEVPTRLEFTDGERTRYLTTVMQPWVDDDGAVVGVLNVSFDVTDQVVARQAVDSARQEAETANRAKDEFLAMLGHELRNPLSPILTATQLMRMRGNEGHELAIIERQVSHLVRLVDDLLDVSRIAQGKVELRKHRLELASVVLRGIELASPLMEQRRQELDLRVAGDGLLVDGDPDRLAQVVSNLVTNASKYSEPGTKIQVIAGRAGNVVRLHVLDHGMGIAPEMLGTIFDSFVQQPQAIDRSKGGLGLGLSIVRSLVQLHGGTVQARSEGSGMGSEFVVELPLASEAQAHGRARNVPSPKSRQQASDGAGKRILVVDDNQDAADSMAEVLTELGYEVQVAHDGPAGIEAARWFKPNICLLDIGLPVMDGYELARSIRQIEGVPEDVRLIAITGYGQHTDRHRAQDAGFDAHVVKPVNLDVLTTVLRN